MDIKIYGSGCARCTATEQVVASVIATTKCDANLEKVTDLKAIMAAGIMSTPAIEMDGKVVCAGRVPDKAEILNWMCGEEAGAVAAGGSCRCSCGGNC